MFAVNIYKDDKYFGSFYTDDRDFVWSFVDWMENQGFTCRVTLKRPRKEFE